MQMLDTFQHLDTALVLEQVPYRSWQGAPTVEVTLTVEELGRLAPRHRAHTAPDATSTGSGRHQSTNRHTWDPMKVYPSRKKAPVLSHCRVRGMPPTPEMTL